MDDDRFGALVIPEEQTIVQPGGVLCNTELGLPVTLVVAESDEGTTIINHAIATVQTMDGERFQAADEAAVEVPTPMPPTGASGLRGWLITTVCLLAAGCSLVMIGRRRPS